MNTLILMLISVCFFTQTPNDTEYSLHDYYQVIGDCGDLDISYVKKVDLDQDGRDEVIVALGSLDSFMDIYLYEKLYVFNSENLSLIEDLEMSWLIEGIQVVKLETDESDYLYLNTTNAINRSGIRVLSLEDGKLQDYDIPSSAYGSGSSELIDSDGDGYFDIIDVYQWSYTSLYYEVFDAYKLTDGAFENIRRDVEVYDYPKDLRDLIYQYIALSYLNEYECEAVNDRLMEITNNQSFLIDKIQYVDIMYALLALDDEALVYEEDLKENEAYIKVSNPIGSEHIYHYEIYAEKIEDKWHITKIVEK